MSTQINKGRNRKHGKVQVIKSTLNITVYKYFNIKKSMDYVLNFLIKDGRCNFNVNN